MTTANTLMNDNKTVAQQTSIEYTRQAVMIHAHNKLSAAGFLLEKHLTPRQRFRRAALSWGLMWLLAAASAFIPIAHFLLVPVFAAAGPALAYLRYRQQTITEAVEGQCPSCLQEFRLLLDQRTALPYRDVCPHCDRHIQIKALDHDK